MTTKPKRKTMIGRALDPELTAFRRQITAEMRRDVVYRTDVGLMDFPDDPEAWVADQVRRAVEHWERCDRDESLFYSTLEAHRWK